MCTLTKMNGTIPYKIFRSIRFINNHNHREPPPPPPTNSILSYRNARKLPKWSGTEGGENEMKWEPMHWSVRQNRNTLSLGENWISSNCLLQMTVLQYKSKSFTDTHNRICKYLYWFYTNTLFHTYFLHLAVFTFETKEHRQKVCHVRFLGETRDERTKTYWAK